MKKIVLALGLLLAGLSLSACKFQSSSLFDNNCSKNGGIYYEAHCKAGGFGA